MSSAEVNPVMVVHGADGLSTVGTWRRDRAVRLSTAPPVASTAARWFPTGSCTTTLDPNDQVVHLVEDLAALAHEGGDLLHRVHDGGVVPPTEFPGDGGERVVGEVPEQVHADLTGDDKGPAPARSAQLVDGESEGPGGGLEDLGRGDGAGLA